MPPMIAAAASRLIARAAERIGEGARLSAETAALSLAGQAATSLTDPGIGKSRRADAAITTLDAPDDPLFGSQWHLHNTGQSGGTTGVDIHVLPVWEDYTGRGVTVGIWDDGIDYAHADLDDAYDTGLHITIGGVIHDPFPQAAASAHGTSVAGLIAAERNGEGAVGVAYGARIAGVDMFYDPALDFVASMMTLGTFDVTNHSWGYTTPFANNQLDPGWQAFFAGWRDSVETGRDGLGTINVTAAGNDRQSGRDANDQNKNSLPETIAVAAIGHDGFVSYYSTPGAAILVGATSNGPAGSGMWTTDVTGAGGYSTGSNEPGNALSDYTANFGGTSAASPVVAGVVALMLEANPLLGWRDVQSILAASARQTGSALGSAPAGTELHAWSVNAARTWNGGGMHFSNDYGFGLVDALAAVRLAESWSRQATSHNRVHESAATWAGLLDIPDDTPVGVSVSLDVAQAMMLEHVELRLTWQSDDAYTGDYLVTLTSPDGTTSTLSQAQVPGMSATASWQYMSNQFRGESAVGTWTLHVSDRWAIDRSALVAAELILSGAEADANDLWILTEAFGTLAGGAFGHSSRLEDANGGSDTLNAAAILSDQLVDLSSGSGLIDGVAVALSGLEHVVSGDGADRLTGSDAANHLRAMRGDDRIEAGLGADTLDGGQGNDTLLGGRGDDMLFGGAGDDLIVLETGAGFDAVDGGEGVDTFDLRLTDRNMLIDLAVGQFSSDVLGVRDLSGIEVVLGGAGDESIVGSSADETLHGGRGDDVLRPGGGGDWLLGETGHDHLYAGAGGATLDGGGGKDTLFGSSAWTEGTLFIGGDGTGDVLDFGAVTEGATIDLRAGTWVAGAVGGGVETIEHVIATMHADLLDGDAARNRLDGLAGNDRLNGRGGADTLNGGEGDDLLSGSSGNDWLTDGVGHDTLNGGSGADVFDLVADGMADLVLGFQIGLDRIRLAGAAFESLRIVTMPLGQVLIQTDDDVLVVRDAAGVLWAADFGAADFLFA